MVKFFEKLDAIITNFDLNLLVRKNKNEGTLSISVLPENFEGDQKTISPIIITGTPEELDTEFFAHVIPPLQKAGVVVKNVEEFQRNIDLLLKSKKEQEKKLLEKKKKPSTTTASTTAKEAVKTDVEAKPTPKPQADLFGNQ